MLGADLRPWNMIGTELHRFRQYAVIDKMTAWIALAGGELNRSGLCSGLAALWGAARARDVNEGVNRYEAEFLAEMNEIENWNGVSREIDHLMMHTINDVNLLQGTRFGLGIEQADYQDLAALAQGAGDQPLLGRKEFTFDGVFTKDELVWAFDQILEHTRGKMIRVSSTDHAGAMVKNGHIELFDPNQGMARINSTRQLADSVQKLFLSDWFEVTNTEVGDSHIPISIHIFDMPGSEAANYPRADLLMEQILQRRRRAGQPLSLNTWDYHDHLWMNARRGSAEMIKMLVKEDPEAARVGSGNRMLALDKAKRDVRPDEIILAFYPEYDRSMREINVLRKEDPTCRHLGFKEVDERFGPGLLRQEQARLVEIANTALLNMEKLTRQRDLINRIENLFYNETRGFLDLKTTKTRLGQEIEGLRAQIRETELAMEANTDANVWQAVAAPSHEQEIERAAEQRRIQEQHDLLEAFRRQLEERDRQERARLRAERLREAEIAMENMRRENHAREMAARARQIAEDLAYAQLMQQREVERHAQDQANIAANLAAIRRIQEDEALAENLRVERIRQDALRRQEQLEAQERDRRQAEARARAEADRREQVAIKQREAQERALLEAQEREQAARDRKREAERQDAVIRPAKRPAPVVIRRAPPAPAAAPANAAQIKKEKSKAALRRAFGAK